MLTVVMYHYVRDLRDEYPRIKALLTERFEHQLDYVQEHYTVVDAVAVVEAAAGQRKLPPDACLLSFDDGLADHYETVFPRLVARGLTGAFFPPACSALDHTILDVHKIHFILASVEDAVEVQMVILAELDAATREKWSLPSNDALLESHAVASRYDEAGVIFIKRLLQTVLPQPLRSSIVDRLFGRFVSADEDAFARRLYMSVDQMREMADAGMTIGGHGYRHNWLGNLGRDEQEREISATFAFLEEVHGRPPRDWVMCYPYGSYNAITLEILRAHGAALGLTTAVDLVRDLSRPLELARLDTNDLPSERGATVSQWTERAQADEGRSMGV